MVAMNILAKNVKSFRNSHGMSQKDLAKAIGTSYPRISELENGIGNPTISTVEALSKVFGISVSDLLSEKTLKKFSKTGV